MAAEKIRYDPFDAMLPPHLEHLFLSLPVDSRARCLAVSPRWREFLSPVKFWRELDLSAASGVSKERRSKGMLVAAAARARGTLRVLNVSDWNELFRPGEYEDWNGVSEELRQVLIANPALEELHAINCEGDWIPFYRHFAPFVIRRLLGYSRALRVLACDADIKLDRGDLDGGLELFSRRLRDSKYAPLRLRVLCIDGCIGDPVELLQSAGIHKTITGLELWSFPLDRGGVLEALVGLPFTNQLTVLRLFHCGLSPTSLPALTTILLCGCLQKLEIYNGDLPLFRGPAVGPFCAALRAAPVVDVHLTMMVLYGSVEDTLQIIAACSSHSTLRKLDFTKHMDDVVPPPQIQAALAALALSCSELEVVVGAA